MSMNGITGYNYGYTNPYAVPSYTNTNFQSTYPAQTTYTTTAATEEKDNTGKIILGLGAAAVAVGTTIYAAKKGKAINGENGKLLKNIAEGFKSIWDSASKAVKGLFKQEKSQEVIGAEQLKDMQKRWDTRVIQEQIDEFGPDGYRASERAVNNYQGMIEDLFANAEYDENGVVKNALKRSDVVKN